jgi:hypothetical protein
MCAHRKRGKKWRTCGGLPAFLDGLNFVLEAVDLCLESLELRLLAIEAVLLDCSEYGRSAVASDVQPDRVEAAK